MKILVIGDVTSPAGIEHLKEKLWESRRSFGIDFCIVNGENASFVRIAQHSYFSVMRSAAARNPSSSK